MFGSTSTISILFFVDSHKIRIKLRAAPLRSSNGIKVTRSDPTRRPVVFTHTSYPQETLVTHYWVGAASTQNAASHGRDWEQWEGGHRRETGHHSPEEAEQSAGEGRTKIFHLLTSYKCFPHWKVFLDYILFPTTVFHFNETSLLLGCFKRVYDIRLGFISWTPYRKKKRKHSSAAGSLLFSRGRKRASSNHQAM